MIKLIKTIDETNEFDMTNVEFTIPNGDINLNDLLEVMQDFISAVGYNTNGRYLTFVQND